MSLVADTLLGSKNQYFTQCWVLKLAVEPIIEKKLETLSVSESILYPLFWEIHNKIMFSDTILGVQYPF